MAGITLSGIGSGIDIQGLSQQLAAAETAPAKANLDRQESQFKSQLSALGALKSDLDKLKDVAAKLSDPDSFLGTKAQSSHENILTAEVDNTALAGDYRIEVIHRAQAQRLASSAFAAKDTALGTGTLSVQVGGGSAVDITIDASNNTLEGIRDAINEAGAGVQANIVNDGSGYRLVVGSEETGLANTVSITASGAGLEDLASSAMTETVAARDASIEIDGLPVTSASNTLENVIDGITLNLKNEEPGTVTTLSVSRDKETAEETIKSFVDAYNRIISTIDKYSNYDADTGNKGALLGDGGVRSVLGQLRGVIGGAVDGSSTVSGLASIGISTQRDGKLELDVSKLDEAVQQDPGAVANLFARNESSSDQGIGKRLEGLLERVLDSEGMLSSRTDNLNERLGDISERRERLDMRLERVESRYLAQFAAMDKLVGQLNSTGAFLFQALDNLPTFNNKN